LQGEFAIKVGYFLCQQKAKKTEIFKGGLKPTFFGALLPAQNCVCCRGLRDAAYGYIVGLEVWGGIEKLLRKKEQKLFSPTVTCTV